MSKLLIFIFISFVLIFASPVFSQTILFEESFTDGNTSLEWFSAWNDSVGNPLTQMVATNEAGPTDDWIGVVTGDTAILGSLGSALTGDAELGDYSVEADVYVELATGYYTGLMLRSDTTDRVKGYQFVSNFYSPWGVAKVRFRYFSELADSIRILADISAADLPGGAPSEDGWHKMKVKAVGNQFWLYWDGEEIVGSPFTDPEAALDKGYFGAYVWDAFSETPPAVKIDNIVVREEGVYKETFDQGTSLEWFSAWSDSVGNPLTPMVATNETGPTDDWIGVVTGDTAILGSLGSALTGDPEMGDYSVEADVFVELGTGYYTGLMIRADTSDRVKGYQFVSNFYSPWGVAKVRFRYFSELADSIRILADISAADLPGGAPSEDGWHKMKVKAVGNQFWLYWDGEEIVGSPFTDPEAALDKGYFGAYVWDAFSETPPSVKIDNIVVKAESPVSAIPTLNNPERLIKGFVLHNNYPNPFNPVTTIAFDLEKTESINLSIYDINGRIVKTIANGTYSQGRHQVQWDATNSSTTKVSAGVYFYILRAKNGLVSKKMILLK